MTVQRAPDGYLWMRVHTPTVFAEYLIPVEGEMTPTEERNYEHLHRLAECHRTGICGSTYRTG